MGQRKAAGLADGFAVCSRAGGMHGATAAAKTVAKKAFQIAY
jgi:hypothetical protein